MGGCFLTHFSGYLLISLESFECPVGQSWMEALLEVGENVTRDGVFSVQLFVCIWLVGVGVLHFDGLVLPLSL